MHNRVPDRLRRAAAGTPVFGLLFVVATSTLAQTQEPVQEPVKAPRQEPDVRIEPRISLAETWTNNVGLTSNAQKSQFVTEVSPGIRLSSRGPRLNGYLDYAVNEVMYDQNSSANRTQHALNTFGSLEAIENWAFLDLKGSIAQQVVSVFGTPSSDNTAINANRTEVSSYSASPYVRGHLGSLANYIARYTRTQTQSNSSALSNLTQSDSVVKIASARDFASFGWSADASQSHVDYSAGRPTDNDAVTLGLSYLLTPQLVVSVNAGEERNNYASLSKQSYGTSGFGVNWTPSQNTRISAAKGDHAFGYTHDVSVEHTTPRTAWKFTDIQQVVSTPNQAGRYSLGPVYDILFTQFASLEPNPVARAQLVNSFMQAFGLSQSSLVISNFLASALSQERRQDLSFALLGVRDTITLVASRSEVHRIDTVTVATDDFSSASVIRQNGISANYAHRLSPQYTLGVLAAQQNISGDTRQQDVRLRSFSVNVLGKINEKATASLGLRHAVFSSDISPYNETAITANLTVQF